MSPSIPDVSAIAAAASEARTRGFATLRRFLDPGDAQRLLSAARETLDLAMGSTAASGQDALFLRNIINARGTAAPGADGKLSFHVEHVFRHVASFRSVAMHPKCVRLASELLGDTPVILDDQLYWKPRGAGGATYLHRDSDFFGPLPVVTVWMPLTAVDEASGCLWFVPGSRKGTDAEHGVVRRVWQASDDPDRDRSLYYFYAIDEARLSLEPVRAEPGDVVVLDSEVLHLSRELAPDRERLSYLIEYTGRTAWQTWRQELRGLFEYHNREQHMVVCGD